MDNTPQNVPIPENIPSASPDQSTATEASKAHLNRKGMKTLRPLDNTLADEIKEQKPVPTHVQSPQAPISHTPGANSSTRSISDLQSIYPEAKHLLAGSPDNPSTEDSTSSDDTTQLIKVLVIAIGLIIVIFSSFSLYSWSRFAGFIHLTASPSLIFILVMTVLELLLGIGIIFRNEISRSIYVLVAIIFLLFSIYIAFKNYNTIFNFENQNISIIFRYFEGIGISALPIIFLTRKRVMEVFN